MAETELVFDRRRALLTTALAGAGLSLPLDAARAAPVATGRGAGTCSTTANALAKTQ